MKWKGKKCKSCKKPVLRNGKYVKNKGAMHHHCWSSWYLKRLWENSWKLCSEYVRRRDNGRCITCGIRKDWKEMQAGHFVHQKQTPVYFDEKNVHCQCVRCNHHEGGRRDDYLREIQRRYGMEEADRLLQAKYKIKKYSISELENIRDDYQRKLSNLKS